MNMLQTHNIKLYHAQGLMEQIKEMTHDENQNIFIKDIMKEEYYRVVGMYNQDTNKGQELVLECVSINEMFDGVDWARNLHDYGRWHYKY